MTTPFITNIFTILVVVLGRGRWEREVSGFMKHESNWYSLMEVPSIIGAIYPSLLKWTLVREDPTHHVHLSQQCYSFSQAINYVSSRLVHVLQQGAFIYHIIPIQLIKFRCIYSHRPKVHQVIYTSTNDNSLASDVINMVLVTSLLNSFQDSVVLLFHHVLTFSHSITWLVC